jgi:hypothetical protein
MEQLIYRTQHYKVIVGKSVDSGNLCYQIINKEHGVIEVETYMYPQAIKYASDLEAGIASVLDKDFFKE